MAVYVDDARLPFGRLVMCHMAADSRKELDAMATKIGVSRRWRQKTDQWDEHYDSCRTKRRMAVFFGAQEVTSREIVLGLRAREQARNDKSGSRETEAGV